MYRKCMRARVNLVYSQNTNDKSKEETCFESVYLYQVLGLVGFEMVYLYQALGQAGFEPMNNYIEYSIPIA